MPSRCFFLLYEAEELELILSKRRKGERIAYWSEAGTNLTVLFDQDPAPQWSCYRVVSQIINGPVIMEDMTGPSDSIHRVAGVFLPAGVQEILSSYFLNQWQGRYTKEVRRFNTEKITLPLQSIWHHYVTIMLAFWKESDMYAGEEEDVQEGMLDMYYEILSRGMAGMEVHIPLIRQQERVVYPH